MLQLHSNKYNNNYEDRVYTTDVTMVCCLCLEEDIKQSALVEDKRKSEIQEIFNAYFWFQPKDNDVICDPCWNVIHNFHQLYTKAKEAHEILLAKSETVQLEPLETLEIKIPQNEFVCVNSAKETELKHVEIEENSAHTWEGEDFSNNENVSDDDFDSTNVTLVCNVNLTRRSNRTASRCKISDAQRTAQLTSKPTKRKTEKFLSSSKDGDFGTQTESSIYIESLPKKPKMEGLSDYKKKNSNRKFKELDDKILQYMQLVCEVCNEIHTTFTNLRHHMWKSHGCKGYMKCCNKKYVRRAHLAAHIERHLNPECYKCDDCDKTFLEKQSLEVHCLLKHQPEEALIHQCEFCPKKFAKMYLLRQHSSKHRPPDHICDICNKGFATKGMLTSHITFTHERKGFMCDICAKVICGRSAFKTHQLEHQGIAKPKLQCDICGSWHKHQAALKKHIRRIHLDAVQIECEICHKVCSNRSALSEHKRYVHFKEKKFECNVCKKTFKEALNLKEHMGIHTGERLYTCSFCPQTFRSSANMYAHRKKRHPKEFEQARLKKIGPDTYHNYQEKLAATEIVLDQNEEILPNINE